MKLTSRLIRAKTDFDYGRNNGLGYVAMFIQLATFIEVVKLDRVWYFILIPTGIILTWALGLTLRKVNFRKRENEFILKENPQIIALDGMEACSDSSKSIPPIAKGGLQFPQLDGFFPDIRTSVATI